jgi:hypothetical protein
MRVICSQERQRTVIATDRRSEPLVFNHRVATDSIAVKVRLFRLSVPSMQQEKPLRSFRGVGMCATPHLCSTNCEIVHAVLRTFFFFTQSLQNIFPSFHPARFHCSVVLSNAYTAPWLLLDTASGRVQFNRVAAVDSRGNHLFFPSPLTHFLFLWVHATVESHPFVRYNSIQSLFSFLYA